MADDGVQLYDARVDQLAVGGYHVPATPHLTNRLHLTGPGDLVVAPGAAEQTGWLRARGMTQITLKQLLFQ